MDDPTEPSGVPLELEPGTRLRVETLLADLAARFVNIPADHIDREIEDAQRSVCECLGLDVSALWQWTAEVPPRLILTHSYRSVADPPVPGIVDASEYFPWCLEQLLADKMIVLSSIEDAPAAARRDRQVWREFGVKTTLTIPLSTTGHCRIGAISFNDQKMERAWPELLVKRLQLVAQIFAGALVRKAAERALRESEARYRSIALNLPGLVYQFFAREDGQWGMRYVDAHAERICGLSPDPIETFFDRFAACVAAEDRDRWLRSIREAVNGVTDWEEEFKFVKPTGEHIYLRAFSQPRGSQDEIVFSGVMRDVTRRKLAEAALRESQTTLKAIINSTADMIWSVDHQSFGLLTFNDVLRDYFLQHRNIRIQVGMRPQDLFPTQEHVQQWREFYRRAIREGPYKAEYVVHAQNRILELAFSILEQHGTAFGVAVFGKDITERKRTEAELRRSFDEVKQLQEQLQHENVYLRKAIQAIHGPATIIGVSDGLQEVIHKAQQVAATDSTVLISGETGTGKELLARYVHDISGRSTKPFITTNIAAIPATLLESELFGREKGAYTGALTRQAGRFDLANGGTLLLDEIGEMPPETQVKLLRVLQNGEFERLGSGKTVRVNVRVIAATNRKLPELVRQGSFRADLFYRLNVFPIVIPPLRDRTGDIQPLVWAFVKEFSDKMGKPVERIRKRDIEALHRYHWPGNVRELRNVIERSMIVTQGTELQLAFPDADSDGPPVGAQSLRDLEREHVLRVLKSTGGRIRGDGGAAQILGLCPTTLYSLMDRLGIGRGKRRADDGASIERRAASTANAPEQGAHPA